MSNWMDCGNIKDKNGNDVLVQWDQDSNKIYLKYRSGGEYIKYETAADERTALSKAHAYLHYGS